jgi:hypothetical protein
MLGASAHHRAVAGNWLPHGARKLGRGGIRAGEGDRAVMAEGWWAVSTPGLPDGKLTDWLVRMRRLALRGAWHAGAVELTACRGLVCGRGVA